MIDWEKVTKEDSKLIQAITKRAAQLVKGSGQTIDTLSMNMDLTACHTHDCPLKLQALLDADDFNFAHDVAGINEHINRETGRLEHCFLPRFAQ